MSISKRNAARLIWFSFVGIFFTWQWSTYQFHNLPKDAFLNTEKVIIEESADKITFKSLHFRIKYQIIFFQGGLTDPRAYAPLCKAMAENGFTCHLIKMNWRMPQWDYKKIERLFDLKSGDFILGGHSQGGKMAAQFVYENPNLMKGLFLLGTSHPRDIDLSMLQIPALKLYAEYDGLASVQEVMDNKNKLPANATQIMIPGGNHSQFGYLGKLLTDESATISVEEQQELVFTYLLEFFKTL